MPEIETYEANVKIRALPRSTDRIISALAGLRGCPKHEVVRAALMEYAENHQDEMAKVRVGEVLP